MKHFFLALAMTGTLAGCATQPNESGINTQNAATAAGIGVGTMVVIGFIGATVLAAAAKDAIEKN